MCAFGPVTSGKLLPLLVSVPLSMEGGSEVCGGFNPGNLDEAPSGPRGRPSPPARAGLMAPAWKAAALLGSSLRCAVGRGGARGSGAWACGAGRGPGGPLAAELRTGPTAHCKLTCTLGKRRAGRLYLGRCGVFLAAGWGRPLCPAAGRVGLPSLDGVRDRVRHAVPAPVTPPQGLCSLPDPCPAHWPLSPNSLAYV